MYDIKNLTIWKKEPDGRPSRHYLTGDITELNLSVRSYNCLRRAGCQTVGDILRIIDGDENGLRKIRNLGTRSENEILESLQQYQEQARHPAAPATAAKTADPSPIIKRQRVRSDADLWNSRIEDYRLSQYALTELKRHGIDRVKDLYATNPKNEPGWYAVRELFEKIPAASQSDEATAHEITN